MTFTISRKALQSKRLPLPATALLAVCVSVLACCPLASRAAGPAVNGQAAILVDATTGQVLWQRNAHQHRPPASTTKMMTVMLALDLSRLDDVVTAPPGVQDIPEQSLHLTPGEQISLRDLLYAAMVRSANDSAVAIAHHVGGSVEEFVRLMNARVKDLGLKDTHFTNPNGLNNPDHYSSAYDLAMIAREAIRRPLFNVLCDTRRYNVTRASSPDRLLTSHARFLWEYKGADGIKTGYTHQAGRCFVGSATVKGHRLISVVLKSPNAGADTRALMDYGFNNYRWVTVARAGTMLATARVPGAHPDHVSAVLKDDLVVCLRRGEKTPRPVLRLAPPPAPVFRGDPVGSVRLAGIGAPVRDIPLQAGWDAPRAPATPWALLAVVAGVPAAAVLVWRAPSVAEALKGRQTELRGSGERLL